MDSSQPILDNNQAQHAPHSSITLTEPSCTLLPAERLPNDDSQSSETTFLSPIGNGLNGSLNDSSSSSILYHQLPKDVSVAMDVDKSQVSAPQAQNGDESNSSQTGNPTALPPTLSPPLRDHAVEDPSTKELQDKLGALEGVVGHADENGENSSIKHSSPPLAPTVPSEAVSHASSQTSSSLLPNTNTMMVSAVASEGDTIPAALADLLELFERASAPKLASSPVLQDPRQIIPAAEVKVVEDPQRRVLRPRDPNHGPRPPLKKKTKLPAISAAQIDGEVIALGDSNLTDAQVAAPIVQTISRPQMPPPMAPAAPPRPRAANNARIASKHANGKSTSASSVLPARPKRSDGDKQARLDALLAAQDTANKASQMAIRRLESFIGPESPSTYLTPSPLPPVPLHLSGPLHPPSSGGNLPSLPTRGPTTTVSAHPHHSHPSAPHVIPSLPTRRSMTSNLPHPSTFLPHPVNREASSFPYHHQGPLHQNPHMAASLPQNTMIHHNSGHMLHQPASNIAPTAPTAPTNDFPPQRHALLSPRNLPSPPPPHIIAAPHATYLSTSVPMESVHLSSPPPTRPTDAKSRKSIVFYREMDDGLETSCPSPTGRTMTRQQFIQWEETFLPQLPPPTISDDSQGDHPIHPPSLFPNDCITPHFEIQVARTEELLSALPLPSLKHSHHGMMISRVVRLRKPRDLKPCLKVEHKNAKESDEISSPPPAKQLSWSTVSIGFSSSYSSAEADRRTTLLEKEHARNQKAIDELTDLLHSKYETIAASARKDHPTTKSSADEPERGNNTLISSLSALASQFSPSPLSSDQTKRESPHTPTKHGISLRPTQKEIVSLNLSSFSLSAIDNETAGFIVRGHCHRGIIRGRDADKDSLGEISKLTSSSARWTLLFNQFYGNPGPYWTLPSLFRSAWRRKLYLDFLAPNRSLRPNALLQGDCSSFKDAWSDMVTSIFGGGAEMENAQSQPDTIDLPTLKSFSEDTTVIDEPFYVANAASSAFLSVSFDSHISSQAAKAVVLAMDCNSSAKLLEVAMEGVMEEHERKMNSLLSRFQFHGECLSQCSSNHHRILTLVEHGGASNGSARDLEGAKMDVDSGMLVIDPVTPIHLQRMTRDNNNRMIGVGGTGEDEEEGNDGMVERGDSLRGAGKRGYADSSSPAFDDNEYSAIKRRTMGSMVREGGNVKKSNISRHPISSHSTDGSPTPTQPIPTRLILSENRANGRAHPSSSTGGVQGHLNVSSQSLLRRTQTPQNLSQPIQSSPHPLPHQHAQNSSLPIPTAHLALHQPSLPRTGGAGGQGNSDQGNHHPTPLPLPTTTTTTSSNHQPSSSSSFPYHVSITPGAFASYLGVSHQQQQQLPLVPIPNQPHPIPQSSPSSSSGGSLPSQPSSSQTLPGPSLPHHPPSHPHPHTHHPHLTSFFQNPSPYQPPSSLFPTSLFKHQLSQFLTVISSSIPKSLRSDNILHASNGITPQKSHMTGFGGSGAVLIEPLKKIQFRALGDSLIPITHSKTLSIAERSIAMLEWVATIIPALLTANLDFHWISHFSLQQDDSLDSSLCLNPQDITSILSSARAQSKELTLRAEAFLDFFQKIGLPSPKTSPKPSKAHYSPQDQQRLEELKSHQDLASTHIGRATNVPAKALRAIARLNYAIDVALHLADQAERQIRSMGRYTREEAKTKLASFVVSSWTLFDPPSSEDA